MRDAFKRLFALLNPSLDRINALCSKGITFGDNVRCDVLTVQATHNVPFAVKLKTLTQASACLVVGGDTLLPYPVASVQMNQASPPSCTVTVWFEGKSGTANVRLWLFEEGLQAASALTFS